MAKYERILGNVPVFGSDSKFGKLEDTNGKPVRSGYDFYRSNSVSYEQGVKELTPEVFNGAMNYLTNLIGYTYSKGVPEFTLNVAYDKGAIVTFNGSLYVSLTNENIKHVTQSSHWGKFVIEQNDSVHNDIGCKKDTTDSNPIGTILTVPITVEKEGYIDYVEGRSFIPSLYPDLYTALGTNTFPVSGNTRESGLPVGSIIPFLSTGNVPDGYLEWTTSYGSLVKYPELKQVLFDMANRLPLGTVKSTWLDALKNNALPLFEASGFFLGYGKQVGTYTSDTTKSTELKFAPMVIDASNTLNPLGYSRCAEQTQAVAPVQARTVNQEHIDSPYVILANRTDVHQGVTNKQMYQVVVGDGNETAPKQLAVRLLIKAVSSQPASISSTHKQIIKAY